jgi:drug/metabolite transporter (DMT)-like permease
MRSPALDRAYLAWIVVCLVWGTTYLGIRIALETIPPFTMAVLRWVIAGTLLLTVLKIRGERLPPPSDWPALAVLGVLMIGFGNGAVVWAQQIVPSGLTAVLVSTTPFWMAGIERLLADGERFTARRLLGLAVGFVGVVMLVWPEIRPGTGTAFLGGVLATQLACCGWSVGSSYSRRRASGENVLAIAATQMVFAGLFLAILATARGEWRALHFTNRTLAAITYLTIAGSIVGFSAYGYALKHLPVSTVSLYAYINPVIAVILGALVLREPFGARIAVACAVVLAGTALVRSR